MATYTNQQAWKDIQEFLPMQLHFTNQYHPTEEIWNWKENKIHLDTFRNPSAVAKVICFHGVGTNGRQISMIFGGPLSRDGFETITVDMPTYGVTEVNQNMLITYDDWVECGSDLITAELEKDDRPIFIYGLSAGGMETYHVAAKNKSKNIKGIIGMTFLDQREKQVKTVTTNNKFWGKFGTSLGSFSCKIGLARFKMKMKIPSKMSALVNDKKCLKIMMNDTTSAGNKATMKFLESYMNYVPEIEPEEFDVCPILLTQPEKDRWTPQFLSDSFLDQIKKVSITKTVLRNGSHYPIEAEALADLHKYALDFMRQQLN
ncbi:MAG: alpha/beta hydrolase [bacterium]|nr:alpha/beta hydrolase [bacterium]